jgi:2-dehydro-3-deoxygalactonokinase
VLRARYARAAVHFGITLAGLDPDRVYCAALARFLDRIPS